MATDPPLIEASGGVLWRAGAEGAEVCLVHRPKYDDLSVPKGKLERGEHVVLAAVREVIEETGFSATVGRPLGEIRYLKEGRPKRVRYWAMKATGGHFVENDEVDELRWLSPTAALAALTLDRDPTVIERFAADPVDTVPLVIARHASAGDPAIWHGDDEDRPLDELGGRQAEALSGLLAAYGIEAVLAADVLRCVSTMAPYADVARLTVEAEPLLSERGHAQHRKAAADRLLAIAGSGQAVAVCSQGPVIGDLVTTLCAAYGFPAPRDPWLRKGTAWVAHFAVGEQRLVDLEPLSALP